jgi:hypothetical protein
MPQPYGPAANAQGQGFSEMRVEQDRYRVTYRAPVKVERARVEDMALLRAADLTLGAGYDWFRVIDRFADARGGNGPTLSLGTGSTSFGRSSAVGVGLGTSFQLGGGGTRSVTLEVQFGRGQRPSTPDTYDARDVAETLRKRL